MRVSWKLFEAMKFEVSEYSGDLENLWVLWKLITDETDKENAKWWKNETLSDYKEWKELQSDPNLWIVEILENSITGETTFVDIVRDRATAKAVARHLRKSGINKYMLVRPEPRRYC